MRALILERTSAAIVSVIGTLFLVAVLVVVQARGSLGQAPADPAAPREVAEFFVRLLTAKRVTVKTLVATSAAELPFFRVRLYVGPVVPAKAWRGVDSQLFRDSRGARVEVIELAAPQGAFRARLNEALQDHRSLTTEPEEEGVRMVEVWCRHSGAAGGHVPLLAKVIDAKNRQTGRICHDDLPQLVECLRLVNVLDALEQHDPGTLSASPDAVETLSHGLEVRRADNVAHQNNAPANAVTASLVPGGASIELLDVRELPVSMLRHDRTLYRSLPTGESFIGLASDSLAGTATISFELPFPAGGAAVRAPARITDETAAIDVEVSANGTEWTRLYRLDATTLQDDGLHALPASMHGAATIMVRARLTAMEATAVPVRDVGLRFLPSDPPVANSFRLRCDQDVLTVVRAEQAVAGNRSEADRALLRLVVQPKVLDSHAVSAMVQADPPEIDLYAPCELDEDACLAIGAYAGDVRFWSPPDWKNIPVANGRAMVAGPGLLGFPRLETIPAEWATLLAAGKKSLRFPRVREPSQEVLAALATCSVELSLDGVETLSPEQGTVLGNYRGPALSLAGLRRADLASRPTDGVLRAVVASSGTCTLSELTELDEATASLLAAGQKHLVLDAVSALSAPVATVLSRAVKGLSLNGVAALDPEAAGALLSFSGESLSLAGLRSVACRVDDLPAAAGTRRESLQSLLRPPRTADEEDKAERDACQEDLEAMIRQLMKMAVYDVSDGEELLAKASEGTDALKEVVASIRKEHPDLPIFSKVRIDPPTSTPLDACVRSPGVFVLHPPDAPAIGRKGFSKQVATVLANGRKHLDLDCLTDRDLTPDVATALASSSAIVSLDGITVLENECAVQLLNYQGPLLALDNVEQADAALVELIMPMFKAGRLSLPKAGLIDVDKLRDFVEERRDENVPETPDHKKLFNAFLDRSKKQEWSPVGPIPKFRARVLRLFPGEVEFEVVTGQVIRGSRANLMTGSQRTLDKLQELAQEVAGVRKEELIDAALSNGASASP